MANDNRHRVQPVVGPGNEGGAVLGTVYDATIEPSMQVSPVGYDKLVYNIE